MSVLDPRDLVAAHSALEYDGDGTLYLAGRPADQWYESLPTPCLLLLPGRAAENARSYQSAFARALPGSSVYYALKACYQRHVVSAVVSAGVGLEVMSELELGLAQELGIGGNRLIVNGLGRSESFTRAALAATPRLIVVDSAWDLAVTERLAAERGQVAPVALRLSVPAGEAAADRLGFAWKQEFLDVLARVHESAWLRPDGVLLHGLSQCADPERLRRHLNVAVGALWELWFSHGRSFPIVDIGGGLASRLAIETGSAGLEAFARAAADELSGVPYPIEVICEPGRTLVADAAVGLATSVATKRRANADWHIIDIGTNMLVPVPGARFPPAPVRWRPGAAASPAGLGDQSCTSAAVCTDVLLPVDAERMLVLDAGAYTHVFSHVWGPELPAVVAITDGGPELITASEDYTRILHTMQGYAR